MITIYKSIHDLQKKNIISDAESFFNGYITADTFGDSELEAMKVIDNAELLDKEANIVKTPRGVTSIDHLSAGCKTAIVYIYLTKNLNRENAIDLSGCGINALEFIFNLEERNHTGTVFILRHKDNVYKCKERDYAVNGDRHITNLAYL